MKKVKELMPYIIILIVVVLIRTFVVTPVRVDGSSMYPTLKNGNLLILKKYDNSFERFDIVVVKMGKERIVKRIIGLPGESIRYTSNHLFINGKKIDLKEYDFDTENFDLTDLELSKIPKNSYFVLGDNRSNSMDSRYFGPVAKDDIIGSSDLRFWPLNKVGKIK